MKRKYSSFTWSLIVISHLISSHLTSCFSDLSLIPSYPPKTQIGSCHPSFSNIFYINSVTQIIWPKFHQAGLLHSFTLSLSHTISHCIYPVFIPINPNHWITQSQRRPPTCHNDACVLVHTLSLESLSISPPPTPTPRPRIFIPLQMSLHSAVDLMKIETNFYFLLTAPFPASGHSGGQTPCLIYLCIPGALPHMNWMAHQRWLNWTSLNFTFWNIAIFHDSPQMQHHCESLSDLDGPIYSPLAHF